MKRSDVLMLAAAAALTVPSVARGENARVFVTSTDNEFVEVDFATGTTRTAGQANGAQFQGLAVSGGDQDIRVLVSSSSQGGELLIFDPDSGTSGVVVDRDFPGSLGGLTVDGLGNVYALSDGSNTSSVWLFRSGCTGASCLPGGYSARETLVAAIPGVQRLADVKVASFQVPGLLEPGDLVIATARPGGLFRVADPLGCGTSCAAVPFPGALAGVEPTGLAFAPDGDLLVSIWEGDVLRIGFPAYDQTASFTTSGTPGNATAVSVTRATGAFGVFVATQNGGAVTRYDLDGNEIATVSDGFQAPNGIGSLIATLGAATPPGANQTVRSTADEITFDVVTAAGVTTMQAFVFDDPRPGVDSNPSEPLSQSLFLADVDGLPPDVPADLEIPAYFRPRSAENDPDRKIIVLMRGDTTALFSGTINHHVFEHFGAEADCHAPDSWQQPRLLWARDTGGVMEDITSGCGSDVGRAWRFSWFALAHDTRSLEETLDAKLTALDDAATCLGRRGNTERKAVASAQRDARRGRFCDAQAELDGLVAGLDATAGACEAEVEARALSAGYTASLLCN